MPPPEVDTARIEALEAEVAALPVVEPVEPVDLASVETSQAELSDRLDAMAARLDALESAPAPEVAPPAPPVDLDPLRAEVDSAAEAVDALRADLEPRIAAAESGLADAATRADDVQDEALALARETARNQVTVALQSGAAFDEPLAVLGEAPEALTSVAATGVATGAALVAAFPPLAREALRAARDASPDAGVGSLFRNAFNARSLEPQAGDDPDAVLSRAEAAVRDGELETALTEIGALPEPARAVFSDWTARARARVDALAAAQDFLKDG